MALTTITSLKDQLGGGSRPNLFQVDITFPTGVNAPTLGTNATLLCKSAALPGMTIGQIEVPFRGRSIKLPGDRSFAEWTTTFISDSTFGIRSRMENWVNYIKNGNFATTTHRASTTVNDYYGTVTVKQLDDSSAVIRTYGLQLCFPTDVSAMDVSYDTTDAIQEFSVTFQYSYFTAL